jgi:hypothetical protein
MTLPPSILLLRLTMPLLLRLTMLRCLGWLAVGLIRMTRGLLR